MMTGLFVLIKRNCKLFFKDKGMFFTSLITPLILLVLYATFLENVYKDSFTSAIPEGFQIEESLLNGTVGAQLVSSLLAVSCVTVAFCSNLIMVQDKITKAKCDLMMTPVKSSTMSLAYFISSAAVTLIIGLTALVVCLIYLAIVGWYMSVSDVFLLILDVVLLTLFGTALSSLINFSLSTNGQASAIGTIVSAGYGFICGAYMPISSFGTGLQKVILFLPGTYGTSLIRNHAMGGVYNEMINIGFPLEMVDSIKDSIDCNIYFFGNKVQISTMYLVMIGSIVLLIGLYVLLNMLLKKKNK